MGLLCYSVDMKTIPLTQGKVALVDDEDFEELSKYNWHNAGRYAVRHTSRKSPGGRKTVFMHRQIMNAPSGKQVDHKNGNRYDNRKSNLRFSTQLQNCWNACTRKDNKTGYKGVHYRPKSKDFVVYISVNKKRIHLKTYRNIDDAIKARKEAELKYHGEFAYQRRA